MSSSTLINVVPLFNGDNGPHWFQQMQAYLMSTGEWNMIEDYLGFDTFDSFVHTVRVPDVKDADGKVVTAAHDETKTEKCLSADDRYLRLTDNYIDYLKENSDWKAKDSKVRGHLLLRCSPAVQNKIRNEGCAFDMWKVLTVDYDVIGTSGVYNVFLQFLHVRIPAKGNPTQAIDKMDEYHRRLIELDVDIPEFLFGMLLLSKLPAYMKFVQQISQMEKVDEIRVADIKARAINAWQAEFGVPRNSEASNRVSGVQRNRGAPSFRGQRGGNRGRQQGQQRQQPSSSNDSDERGDNNTNGRTRKRGRGRGRGRGGYNGAREANSSHFLASQATISMTPPRELGPEDASLPYSLKSVHAGPLHKPSPTTFHPSMGAASRLANKIGVKGSPEALRILERVVTHLDEAGPSNATIEEVDDDDDYVEDSDAEDTRASKRARSMKLIDRIEDPYSGYLDSTTFGEDVDEEILDAIKDKDEQAVDEDEDHEFC